MNVLLIHNQYNHRGGEDIVVEQEYQLLKKTSINTEFLIFSNQELSANIFASFYKTIYNVDSVKLLEKKITDFNPDIIHIHNIFYFASPSILFTAKKFGIPVVMTVHNYRLICNGATLLRDGAICEKCIKNSFPLQGIKYACFQESSLKSIQLTMITGLYKMVGTWKDKVDKYIFLTEFARKKYLNSSLNISREQSCVKPNFVEDLEYSTFEKRDDFYLFIGRLSKEKGVDILLNSFIKNGKKLIILGDGPLKGIASKKAENFYNISFLGSKNKEELMCYLKNAKALIFPSICYEGMPMTILEAYSTGTPVISSNIDNVNEIVHNNVNGLHFKTGDSKSLSNTIEKFEAGDYKHLYSGARQTYEKYYTPKKNLEQLLSIYQSVIKSNAITAV